MLQYKRVFRERQNELVNLRIGVLLYYDFI
jgi:hypothetical protein